MNVTSTITMQQQLCRVHQITSRLIQIQIQIQMIEGRAKWLWMSTEKTCLSRLDPRILSSHFILATINFNIFIRITYKVGTPLGRRWPAVVAVGSSVARWSIWFCRRTVQPSLRRFSARLPSEAISEI